MARTLRPAAPAQVDAAELGLARLREARDLFAAAGAPRATARIALAINSAEGAVRHARRRRNAAGRA